MGRARTATAPAVAIYLRQSLDQHGDGLAVDRQREDCRRLCADRGWTDVTEFVDNSVSASTGVVRPAYRAMLDAIRAGRVGAVVVWDLDRLHRRPIELEEFITLADEHRLALASVGGDADLSTDNGRLFARIKGAVARAEVERKSVRQKRAILQKAQAGHPRPGGRPFGFEPDGITHRRSEARLIEKAYDDLLAGRSQGQIARDWNTAGITTSRGSRWTQPQVRLLLLRARNAGLREHHGEVVGPAVWKPIVPEQTWRTARAMLTDDTRKGHSGGKRKHLLPGLARCGICGAPVRSAHHRNVGRQYVCSATPHLARRADWIDHFVAAVVAERLSREDARDLLVDDDRPDVDELRRERDVLRRRLDDLAVEYADGGLTASQLRIATQRLRDKIAAAEAAMSHLDRAPILSPLLDAADVRTAFEALPLERRRAVVDLLVTVTIGKGTGRSQDFDTIGIEWKAAS